MTIETALTALGVRDDLLTAAQKAQLDRDGFLALPGILSPEQVSAITSRLDALLAEEGENAGKEVQQEPGTERLSNLVNKGEVFDVFYTQPSVLSAISHVLRGDLKLSSLNARFAKPGEGNQALHADWGRLETPGEYQVCNSIWLLDDFTADNGATRVVAGTHLREDGKTPREVIADPSQPHPDEQLLLAPAGTVVVFNSHTWHGGTLNKTLARRRALHSYFTRRAQAQQLDQQAHLTPETWARLSEPAKVILAVQQP